MKSVKGTDDRNSNAIIETSSFERTVLKGFAITVPPAFTGYRIASKGTRRVNKRRKIMLEPFLKD